MLRQHLEDDPSAGDDNQLRLKKLREEREARLEEFRKTGRLTPDQADFVEADEPEKGSAAPSENNGGRRTRKKLDLILLVVEILAVLALIFLVLLGIRIVRNMDQRATLDLLQSTLTASRTEMALPEAVVLPGGHVKPEVGESTFNEAEIPEALRGQMQVFALQPTPTESPQQAVRIQIPALELDAPIVMGDGWEELKQGVGQHIGSGLPGQAGNLVLSAHNDIYGELFRKLDKLKKGDEILILTQDSTFTYVVTGTKIVVPTEVDVLAPTAEATITLISCYPYLVDTRRIVVQGLLKK